MKIERLFCISHANVSVLSCLYKNQTLNDIFEKLTSTNGFLVPMFSKSCQLLFIIFTFAVFMLVFQCKKLRSCYLIKDMIRNNHRFLTFELVVV